MEVLVLVSDLKLQTALCKTLEEMACAPLVANTLSEAFVIFEQRKPGMALIAESATGENSATIAAKLRGFDASHRALLLLLTEREKVEDIERAIDAGFDNYLLATKDLAMMRLRLRIALQRAHNRADRFAVEAQLRESIERFQLAVRGTNDGLWDGQPAPGVPWHDPTTKVWYSPRMKDLLGFRDDEMPNLLSSWLDLVHPDDRDQVFQALFDHIEREVPYNVQYRLRTKTGEYRWFSARGQGVWNDRHELVRMAGSVRDITEAKENEAKLAASEAKWRSLVEHAPDIVILATPDGTIQFMNRLSNESNAQPVIGRSVYDFIEPSFHDRVREAIAAACETGQMQRYEVQGPGLKGGTVWYDTRVGPVLRGGRVDAVVLIATDVTYRHLAAEQLQREQRLLRRLLELQERDRQLVAYEIHDGLTQYLAGSLMHLDVLASGEQPFTAELQAEYDRAVTLVREALAEARRLIGGLRPPILDELGVVASLEYLVNEVCRYVPETTLENNVRFARLAAPLEVAIFRITQEALSNVRKHSGAQRATVQLLEHGDWVRLIIRDWGRGFDPETVHEERFGLQGIRQRARLLGTQAVVESEPGKGTIVVVDFPLLREDEGLLPERAAEDEE